MDTLFKVVNAIFPFLMQCPPIVRLLTIVWVALTAILVVIIISCLLWPSASDIVILQPTQNVEVEEGAIVQFRSVHSGLNHYLVVIPMRSPDKWIVDGPLRVSQEVVGTGRARFGSGSVGLGEQFAIAVIASAEYLQEGVLQKLPTDAVSSQYVTVKRVN